MKTHLVSLSVAVLYLEAIAFGCHELYVEAFVAVSFGVLVTGLGLRRKSRT